MGFMLCAFSKDAFQKIVLPETDNTNYSIILRHEKFCLTEDVTLTLDIVGGIWRFKSISGQAFLLPKSIRPGESLHDGDIIYLQSAKKVISIIAMNSHMSLDCFRKFSVIAPCQITIGQAPDNNIQYELGTLVSQHHAIINISKSRCIVQDSSVNGVFLESGRVHGTQALHFGDCLNIMGLQIIWLGNAIAVGGVAHFSVNRMEELKSIPKCAGKTLPNFCGVNSRVTKFRRSPRDLPKLYQDTIEIEPAPQPQHTQKRPLLLTIGPSLTMAIPMMLGAGIAVLGAGGSGSYMYTGIIIAVASALIGTGWALASMRYSGKKEKESEAFRVERYRKYLEEKEEEISQKYKYNAQSLQYVYPAASTCASYNETSTELWNRNAGHHDFLYPRLGIGSLPFQCQITIPPRHFSLVDDPLSQQPETIRQRYETLRDVPVGVDLLDKRLVGILGGKDCAGGLAILHTLAVQIAANNCYTEVKMVFIYEKKLPDAHDPWAFARWLPHTWSADKKLRYIATDKEERSEVCYALANIFRTREEMAQDKKEEIPKPYYVVFVENAQLLEGELAAKYLLKPAAYMGVSTVQLAEEYGQLPNSCINIIENDDDFRGIYDIEKGESGRTAVSFDTVDPAQCSCFARTIAGLEVSETENGGEIPDSLTYFDMLGITSLRELDVAERWRKNRTYENMQVPIGQKAGGAQWYLDLHEKRHGPHGLVAGTTGSGKSEVLQTYILSMAVNFSPEDVSFLVIDFKGGGMANLFSDLPHLAGQISNLSGNQIHRAMVSIKSENRRRQKIFGEFGVNHIDQYTRLYKNHEAQIPIPHLFIVIDEFAELKREEPEFMRQLISVAQVGRSLGVHLILATQKPSGNVDDNIWSNTRFRICLRVQDRQDSNDMLHKPDAAYITQTGRCYMQVGSDEVYELFQAGWSGADYDEGAGDTKTELARMLDITGRSAVVGNHYKMKRMEAQKKEWLLLLGSCLDQAAADGTSDPVADVYSMLRDKQVDYQETKSHAARLANFAHAWASTAEMAAYPERHVAAAEQLLLKQGKKLPERKTKTQLAAVVEYLGKTAANTGYSRSLSLWLPPLPDRLCLSSLPDERKDLPQEEKWRAGAEDISLQATVGLYDDPVNQSQQPLRVDFVQNGHFAVCGIATSGKSTFLQTLLFSLVDRYAPAQLNLYILDYSNRMLSVFEGLCHTGGVVFEDDSEKTEKLFSMLGKTLETRKKLFHGGSFAQFNRVNGNSTAAVLVVIDNYTNFREKTENRFEDMLITLARDGANYGIFLLLSAGGFGAAEIPGRIADNIRTAVCLEMGDRFKYGDVLHTIHFDILPEANVKGRGLAVISGSVLEFQTALSLPAENDFERVEKISRRFHEMNQLWTGRPALKIPCIPDQPVWQQFSQLDDFAESLAQNCLPFGYYEKDASLAAIPLERTYCWLITGRTHTGKTTLLKTLLHTAAQTQSIRMLADFGKGNLAELASRTQTDYISTGEQLFHALEQLLTIFCQRNQTRLALAAKGMSESAIYQAMRQAPPVFFFIDDLCSWLNVLYQPPEGVGNMSGFVENILEKGAMHNVYFVACLDMADVGRCAGKRAFTLMTAYQTGIHLGGNVAGHRLFDFSGVPFAEQNKITKPGVGLLPPSLDVAEARKVVCPDMRG